MPSRTIFFGFPTFMIADHFPASSSPAIRRSPGASRFRAEGGGFQAVAARVRVGGGQIRRVRLGGRSTRPPHLAGLHVVQLLVYPAVAPELVVRPALDDPA